MVTICAEIFLILFSIFDVYNAFFKENVYPVIQPKSECHSWKRYGAHNSLWRKQCMCHVFVYIWSADKKLPYVTDTKNCLFVFKVN